MLRNASGTDRLLAAVGRAMATVAAVPGASRPHPAVPGSAPVDAMGAEMDASQRRLSGALMRVNHVGEVCAQALYDAQAATTRDPALRRFFREAAAEEGDHLAWTRRRLDELGASPSLLNPLWYAGAFTLGAIAGRLGDRVSLGFMVETERQVEQHLASHLERLPEGDLASRAIVEQMKRDEAGHAARALELGAAELPEPVKAAMRGAARVMTTTAHYV
jgi:3-demethoxyubiquinol 3-hydroxylase